MAEEYENYDAALRMVRGLVEDDREGEQLSIPGLTAHVSERLGEDTIAWLDTVRPDSRPHAVPVWFLWDGARITVLAQPGSQKVRNLLQNPNVVLTLETGGTGSDVVIVEGVANLETAVDAADLDAYRTKYAALMEGLGMDPREAAERYSRAIRIVPTRVMSW